MDRLPHVCKWFRLHNKPVPLYLNTNSPHNNNKTSSAACYIPAPTVGVCRSITIIKRIFSFFTSLRDLWISLTPPPVVHCGGPLFQPKLMIEIIHSAYAHHHHYHVLTERQSEGKRRAVAIGSIAFERKLQMTRNVRVKWFIETGEPWERERKNRACQHVPWQIVWRCRVNVAILCIAIVNLDVTNLWQVWSN